MAWGNPPIPARLCGGAADLVLGCLLTGGRTRLAASFQAEDVVVRPSFPVALCWLSLAASVVDVLALDGDVDWYATRPPSARLRWLSQRKAYSPRHQSAKTPMLRGDK